MIPVNTQTYYEWDDIQEFLCKAMGIKEKDFRRYHNVAGGEYRDFWHVWLWLQDNNVSNDSFMPTYLDDNCSDEYFVKRITEQFGEWALDICPALVKLHSEVGESIVIHYSW